MASVLAEDRFFEMELGEAEAPKTAAPAGEAKTFRRYDQAQRFLLPPSLDDWLPEDDEARFVSEVVEDLLDLSAIYVSYESASGAPPYDPRMMLKLLLYGYATGVTSSREMERRCRRDVAFRWLAANEAPDYRSISRFRRRHLEALRPLFLQVLGLCAEAGLVRLGRVALDGTKLTANASRHKAMSYDHIVPKIEQLQAEVDDLLAEAEATDQAEDEAYGADRRGDEVAPELRRRDSRLAKLRAAKEAIESEAKEKAAAAARKKAEGAGKGEEEVDRDGAEAAQRAKPKPSAQRNFTDPEARMMKTNHGFDYAYNAQAVVDEEHQVVLAAEVTDEAGDVNQLVPMIEQTRRTSPEPVSAAHPRPSWPTPATARRTTSRPPRTSVPTCSPLPDESITARGSQPHHAGRSPKTPRVVNAWPAGCGRRPDEPTMPDARRSSNQRSGR